MVHAIYASVLCNSFLPRLYTWRSTVGTFAIKCLETVYVCTLMQILALLYDLQLQPNPQLHSPR